MKPILIYSFSFFLLSFFVFGQEKEVEKKDSLVKKPLRKQSSIFVGADLFLPSLSFVSERKGFRGFIQYQYNERTSLILEGGHETNVFNKINWLVNVNGEYLSAGINHFFLVDKEENSFNGFYVGTRIANAFYRQEIKKYPIYGINTGDLAGVGSIAKDSEMSVWMEGVFGGRVDIIRRKLYTDISFRPRFHIYSTKKENIKPLIIPGFGTNINNLNFDIQLALVYQIDLKKNKKEEK